jgi:hypothetical protein
MTTTTILPLCLSLVASLHLAPHLGSPWSARLVNAQDSWSSVQLSRSLSTHFVSSRFSFTRFFSRPSVLSCLIPILVRLSLPRLHSLVCLSHSLSAQLSSLLVRSSRSPSVGPSRLLPSPFSSPHPVPAKSPLMCDNATSIDVRVLHAR